MQITIEKNPFASELLPAYTEVTTHAVISVHRITHLNLRTIKQ